MSLLLILQKAPDSVVVKESSKTFASEGGTIGRGRNNTWVLEDPERYLSNVHCEISFESGQFYLVDRSTNGTFFNHSSDPIGKGEKLLLNKNDTFILGDYEFSVAEINQPSDVIADLAPRASDPFGNSDQHDPAMSVDDIFATPLANDPLIPHAQSDKPSSSFGFESGSDSLFENDLLEKDPLAALNKAHDSQGVNSPQRDFEVSPDPFASSLQADQVDPLQQQMSWPESPAENILDSTDSIPDDWDDDFLSPAAEAPLAAPGAAAIKPATKEAAAFPGVPPADDPVEAGVAKRKKVISPQPLKPGIADRSFINALGLNDKSLKDADIARINQLAGEVFREMVKGLMLVLASRNTVKNEFRMSVTTIQPKENNPLKFSANVNDAIENMFIKRGDAYLKPLEAVRDGFDSIAEHQLSILAGIREAFKGVTGHFEPDSLEERFAKLHKGALLPVSQKAKNWEAYIEFYNDLVGDMDKSFKDLYWDGFVQAYEDQLNKLSIARKAKNFKNG